MIIIPKITNGKTRTFFFSTFLRLPSISLLLGTGNPSLESAKTSIEFFTFLNSKLPNELVRKADLLAISSFTFFEKTTAP